MSSVSKIVSVFFYEGYISIQPSVAHAVKSLIARGYEVDLFYCIPEQSVPPIHFPPGVRIVECIPWTRRLVAPLVSMLRSTWGRYAVQRANNANNACSDARLRAGRRALSWLLDLPVFVQFCRRHRRDSDFALCFDMTGLFVMHNVMPRDTPFAYWSLEIRTMSEASDPVTRMLKKLEIRSLPEARAVAIQGMERAALIERDVHISEDRYIIIPNGPGARPKPVTHNFFRDKFGIATSTKIVLHAGMISPAALSLEIASCVANWPPDCVLVFHERWNRDHGDPYVQAVQTAGGGRAFLSLDPVSFEDIDLVYAGANIGLVAYTESDANITLASISSGKLSYYLQHGLPIIMVSQKCPAIIETYECGIWIRDSTGIAAALEEILADYDSYSARARDVFNKLFDFEKPFGVLLDKVRVPSSISSLPPAR